MADDVTCISGRTWTRLAQTRRGLYLAVDKDDVG